MIAIVARTAPQPRVPPPPRQPSTRYKPLGGCHRFTLAAKPCGFIKPVLPRCTGSADGTTLVAVTNGVAYKDATTAGNDAVFTFLQPVRTTKK